MTETLRSTGRRGAEVDAGTLRSAMVDAQILATLSRHESAFLACMTVFPSLFDEAAAASVSGLPSAQVTTVLESLMSRGVIRKVGDGSPALFALSQRVRDFVVNLAEAQGPIVVARARHAEYFLARLIEGSDGVTGCPIDSDPAYLEFQKTNLEIVARQQIRRIVGLPDQLTTRLPELTERQWEIAKLVTAGRTNYQIARQLGVSEWTVVNHLRAVMRRLGCSSRVDVARMILLS